MQNLICTRQNLPHILENDIFSDRRRQFVDRLQWDLCLTRTGHEVDEYDDAESTYLVVHKHDKHMGSCRVRPTTSSTMVTDHFYDSFPDAPHFLRMQKGKLYELTRFCRSPDISSGQSKEMLRQLCLLLDGFRTQKKLSGFIAVVFPKVARFMDTIGMRYIVISDAIVNGQPTYLICITQAASQTAVINDGVNDFSKALTPAMMAA